MNSAHVDAAVRLGFERFQLDVVDPYGLTLSDLVAEHRLVALDHDLTDRAKQLIAHARAALFVQQMKTDILIFGGRIELDRDGDETEGKDAAGDGPSHPLRISWRPMSDLRVKISSGLDREY